MVYFTTTGSFTDSAPAGTVIVSAGRVKYVPATDSVDEYDNVITRSLFTAGIDILTSFVLSSIASPPPTKTGKSLFFISNVNDFALSLTKTVLSVILANFNINLRSALTSLLFNTFTSTIA